MKVLIAEHQARVRQALSILLREQVGYQVVGCTEDSADLVEKISRLLPDVLLLDLELPGLALSELVGALGANRPAVIVIGAHPEMRQEALSQGVDFFISKIDSPDRLREALQQARGRMI